MWTMLVLKTIEKIVLACWQIPWSGSIKSDTLGSVFPVLMFTLRLLRPYIHILILRRLGLCLIKAFPLMCTRASNHFYDLLVLTSIVYSVLLHLMKSGSSFFPPEWHHRHLVSIHLLIAAGYGYQLGPAWYLAFTMPPHFKRDLHKTLSAFSTPP